MGFYYLNSRYYDPQIGRFITADKTDILTATPEEPLYGINLFAYCDNNPVMRADTGGDFDLLLWEPFAKIVRLIF